VADNQKKGLDRYLQRMDKAKELREEKQKLEESLFAREKKWKPHLTTPVEPKLSAFLSKGERDVTVKALNKPFDIVAKGHSPDRAKARKEEPLNRTQEFINLTMKTRSQFVEIRPEMTFEDAVTLIH
jgi:hypothetical protein